MKDRGIASWYGEAFHGKTAANGELFNMNAMTAAHRTLPLGSVIRVVNVINGKYVRVRINDRGPYVPGRILDLSHAAAVRLGMVNEGTSAIQLEMVGDGRPGFLVSVDGPGTENLVARLVEQHASTPPVPPLPPHRMMDSHKVPAHARVLPTDVLHERRVRRVSA
ncbi:MAG: septal ring lytic transglycosylase RlpA family protein, partial [Nitrospiraceae bacterium]